MKKTLWALLLAALLMGGPLACGGGATSADDGSESASAQDDSKEDEAKSDDDKKKKKRRGKKGDDEDEEKREEAVPVELAVLGRGEIESVLRYTTNLEAEDAVGVFSQAGRAGRVERLLTEEGREVRKGQLLLQLQSAEQRTALAKTQASYDSAKREYDRQQRLFKNELISEQAYNDATLNLEQLELALEEGRREVSYTEIRAPISGVVTARMVGLGDNVTLNQHLFQIVDFNSIVALVFVPEKELAKLQKGLAARVFSPALGSEIFPGKIERIAPVVDPRSGTVKVTVSLPRGPGLRPGMYVDVELVAATEGDALLLPKRSLVYDQDQIFAFRLKEVPKAGEPGKTERRVERVQVRPRLEDKDNVAPLDGFAAGDQLVIAGQAGLKDGALVRLAGEKVDEEGEGSAEKKAEEAA